ncbi:MAG: hypothetical protein E6Q33_04585 [Neisseriales bacterium]|nr:MAG: hypothetical protein E6Q33_04585 [Neisseriales bacterium]
MKNLALNDISTADANTKFTNSLNKKSVNWLRKIINAYIKTASRSVEVQITSQLIVSRVFSSNRLDTSK